MGQTHTTEDAAANPYVDGVDGRNPWLDAPEDDSPALSADESAKPAGTSRASMLLPPFLRNRKRDADTDQRGRVVKRRVGTDHSAHTRRRPRTVLDVLGYKRMLPSGVAWLGDDEWSLTLRTSDINYLAAAGPHQEAIVDQWAKYINSFGSGTRLEVTVINRVLEDAEVVDLLHKRSRGDHLDEWRADFNAIVRQRLATISGNSVTEKYLTITVQEDDREKAEASLLRLGSETAASLRSMDDCRVTILDRTERLRVLSHLLRPHQPFLFDEQEFLPNKRLRTQDYIAPWSITTTTSDGPLELISSGDKTFHDTLWVRDYPVWLSDRLISELTDIKADITASLHLEPYDQAEGKELLDRQIAEIDMQLINERKKAKKQGYDQDQIPQSLQDAAEESKELRDELRESNQKVFSSVLVIGISAPTADQLAQYTKRVRTLIRRQSCVAERTAYMQRDALTTELPLGIRALPMRRTLTTASAAVIVPFTTQEVFQPGGVHYGYNQQSRNAVCIDRLKNANQNGFILGASGQGKGMAGKNEIFNLRTNRADDDIIIIDPEQEYEPLVTALKGAVVRIHPSSENRLNPLDIDLEDTTMGDPIAVKAQDVINMLRSLIGGHDGLTSTQVSVLDRCTVEMYRRYAADGGKVPTLADLRARLLDEDTEDATRLADSLEIYTSGSLNAFSRLTNVNVDNRLVSYDISGLGPELRTFGMMVILNQIWQRVARNKRNGRRTWIYVDEFHVLFNDKYAATFFKDLYKRLRKYGGGITGITQDVEELLESADARLMLSNSSFLYLLGQSDTNAETLTQMLALSEQQSKWITNVKPGTGLIRTGSALVPVDGEIPRDSRLFQLYNTDVED